MRRGRGKGKRQNASSREDGEDEEKIPAYKRRGGPQKPAKDENEGGEEIMEKDYDTNDSVASKEEVKEDGRKRKKPVESKESSNIAEEEKGLGSKSSTDVSVKSSGFRQIGSRRKKNKPRRAAEAVVECSGV
ncbi:Uncharacterized protein Rs2_22903 [Raphanus sativus]|uniref:Uncharacterized protein LOC108862319 n=1 Tax=Raphanus sativus TaxID=3726 RepID=A0A6J0P5J6_RAPSA|nr:uncharacterized protein LOC108862319 [Raphanus sativus]XP_018491915.2 uncharacterized protein LOC108862319 [Raphanus sativus]KAJ4896109.1 Uncharacterized protein Rs2_22903 [Raphanus sativus]